MSMVLICLRSETGSGTHKALKNKFLKKDRKAFKAFPVFFFCIEPVYSLFARQRFDKNILCYIRNAGAGRRLVLTSARRGAALHRFEFTENDSLVFGRETSGLPPEVIGLSPHHVRIPIKGEVRSINLSTAAGIVLFQALVSAGLVGE